MTSTPYKESEPLVTRYRGRHRAPSITDTVVDNSGRIAAGLVTTGVLATIPVLAVPSAAYADAPDSVRDAIINCESGGDENAQNKNSTASGLYQFVDGTWKAYGGKTKHAKDASASEQTKVFERAFADAGTTPWNASKDCWQGKSGVRKAETHKSEGKRSNGKVAEQSDKGKRRAGTEIPDGYTVKSGDTLGKLATQFHVDGGVNAIAKANHIANPDLIFVGQKLS